MRAQKELRAERQDCAKKKNAVTHFKHYSYTVEISYTFFSIGRQSISHYMSGVFNLVLP